MSNISSHPTSLANGAVFNCPWLGGQTYVGNILIAVNPFQWLGLYTDEMSAQYTNVHNKSEHPPHLFVIADSAYHSMMRNKKPQVCRLWAARVLLPCLLVAVAVSAVPCT